MGRGKGRGKESHSSFGIFQHVYESLHINPERKTEIKHEIH